MRGLSWIWTVRLHWSPCWLSALAQKAVPSRLSRLDRVRGRLGQLPATSALSCAIHANPAKCHDWRSDSMTVFVGKAEALSLRLVSYGKQTAHVTGTCEDCWRRYLAMACSPMSRASPTWIYSGRLSLLLNYSKVSVWLGAFIVPYCVFNKVSGGLAVVSAESSKRILFL